MQFSLLNSSDIKMVPQYCSYGSAGVPAVPATIFLSWVVVVVFVIGWILGSSLTDIKIVAGTAGTPAEP